MNISCPSCEAVYRVDPDRVPVGGAVARCRECKGTFRVGAPASGDGAAAAPRTEAAGTDGAAPSASVASDTAGPATDTPAARPAAGHQDPTGTAEPAGEPQGSPAATAPDAAGEGTAETAAAEPEPTGEVAVPERPAFGPQDPHQRAQRIARALVSDITVYHPERVERSRGQGTLRTEFRDEILKSWDEYVQQVGDEMARGTNYFREALNKILAQGQKVF